MSVILSEPEFIYQEKTMSCWFACLKMLLLHHTGSRSVGDAQVSALASWYKPRALDEINPSFLKSKGIRYEMDSFDDTEAIEKSLLESGPFVACGKFGKLFVGKRMFGHAVFVYGVNGDGSVLHHDPAGGKGKTMKGDTYLREQYEQRWHYKTKMIRA